MWRCSGFSAGVSFWFGCLCRVLLPLIETTLLTAKARGDHSRSQVRNHDDDEAAWWRCSFLPGEGLLSPAEDDTCVLRPLSGLVLGPAEEVGAGLDNCRPRRGEAPRRVQLDPWCGRGGGDTRDCFETCQLRSCCRLALQGQAEVHVRRRRERFSAHPQEVHR